MRRMIFAGILLHAAFLARAADICPDLQRRPAPVDTATRIATIACAENILWYRPFITADGRVASTTVAEGESSRLADGSTQTWQRVAAYWRDSGLLPYMEGFAGAMDCAYAPGSSQSSPSCRAFIIDHPWSAAFVSYVMRKAGVPGFRGSAAHFDYVRDAWVHPGTSAFLFLDPASATPATGDLMCYVRVPTQVYGYPGLVAAIDAHGGPFNMHCDIVVAVDHGKAYLIGGNVQQGVTMRLLNVNRNGNFWGLPQRSRVDPGCSPDSDSSCNFNRQDWAVLLKLKPPAALAVLPHVGSLPPSPGVPTSATPSKCCVNCVLGANPPVPRCPVPGGS